MALILSLLLMMVAISTTKETRFDQYLLYFHLNSSCGFSPQHDGESVATGKQKTSIFQVV